jgi:hypothetical protein
LEQGGVVKPLPFLQVVVVNHLYWVLQQMVDLEQVAQQLVMVVLQEVLEI